MSTDRHTSSRRPLERAAPVDPSLRTAAALARFAVLPAVEHDPRRLLHRLAVLVAEAVPAAAWVSISVGPPLDPVRLATCAGTAQDFDGRQLRAHEGPGCDAYATGAVVGTCDVTSDVRWPVLARLAEESPVRSVLSLPVRESVDLTGVLSLYAPGRCAFDAATRRLAGLVATAVGGALQSAAERRALRERAGHLEQALTSRAAIDQAKGMLMARFGGTPEDAFARLVTMSNQRNVRLRILATQITEGRLDELLDTRS